MVDAVSTVKTLLSGQWNSANTDSMTPQFEIVTDVKTLHLADYDYIRLYEIDENINPFGIGGTEWAHNPIVTIDITTTYKRAEITDIRAHLIKLKDEVFRIIKAKITAPGGTYHQIKLRRKRDLSDRKTGFGRMVIDVSVEYWGT